MSPGASTDRGQLVLADRRDERLADALILLVVVEDRIVHRERGDVVVTRRRLRRWAGSTVPRRPCHSSIGAWPSVVSSVASLVATSVEPGTSRRSNRNRSRTLSSVAMAMADTIAPASGRTARSGTHGDRSIPAHRSPHANHVCVKMRGPLQFPDANPLVANVDSGLATVGRLRGAVTVVIISFPDRLARSPPNVPTLRRSPARGPRSPEPNSSRGPTGSLANCRRTASASATSSRSPSRTRSTGSSPTSPCWKIGAIPQPVSAKLPGRELGGDRRARRIEGRDRRSRRSVRATARFDRPPPARSRAAGPSSATTRCPTPCRRHGRRRRPGGSTGRPKLIVSGDPALFDTEAPAQLGARDDGCMLVPGPAVPQRPRGLVVPGVAARQPRRAAPAVRRRGGARRRSSGTAST